MKKHKTNDLKKFIKKKFGSQARCAEALNITAQSVYNFHANNPRAMLKHAPEIVAQCDTTWTQLSGEVLAREAELNN